MSAARESDPQSFSDDGRSQRPDCAQEMGPSMIWWIIGGVVLVAPAPASPIGAEDAPIISAHLRLKADA
jgi:hypothetical protein